MCKNCLTVIALIFALSGSGYSGLKSVKVSLVSTFGQDVSDPFVQVGEIASGTDGKVYITDAFQYKIKEFLQDGSFSSSYGKRGKGNEDFQSGPYLLDCRDGVLATVESGTNRVHLFSNSMKQLSFFETSNSIFDIAVDKGGKVYVSGVTTPRHFDETILYYDSKGTVLSKVLLRTPAKDPLYDMCMLALSKDDNLVVACKLRNIISIFNPAHELIAETSIPDLPQRSISDSSNGKLASLPEEILVDIAVDPNDHLFVLGGFYSKHPDRDVYVLDLHGNVLAVFTLPEPTGTLYVDRNGFLFTRENKRTIVRKYRLEFEFTEGGK